MALNKDSKAYTLIVAAVLCLVGSVLVSTAAVVLKPQQTANRQLDRQVNILRVAGLYEPGIDVAAVFDERVEAKVIDFTTGEVAEGKDSPNRRGGDARHALQPQALAPSPVAPLSACLVARRSARACVCAHTHISR